MSAPAMAAVVFDFDGVIADTERLHYAAFRDVFARRGWPLDEREYFDRYLGCDDNGLIAAYAAAHALHVEPDAVDALLVEKTDALAPHLAARGALFPGARGCIEALALRFPLAIASGSTREEIEIVLHAAGILACFRAIVGAADAGACKPSPAPYLAAAARLGVDPRACVAIEDSPPGLQAARAAGMKTIGVTTMLPADMLASADFVIPDLSLLTPALVSGIGSGVPV